MKRGDKWELYCPSELAYGDRGRPPKIPGGAVLVFQMEIISFHDPEEDRAWLEEKGKEDGVVSLPSGLKYKVLKTGDPSGTSPKVDTPCACHYEGALVDGTVFDSSYKRGAPTPFAPNQVIKAWTEAMQLMKPGDKWELYCPSELAYGKNGQPRAGIPGGAVLVFQMEMVTVKDGGSGSGSIVAISFAALLLAVGMYYVLGK